MHYVYLIQSTLDSSKKYIGYTTDVMTRITGHNSGDSIYTQKYKPWKLVTSLAFSNKSQALDFECYLKKASGHAFAKKRLW